MYMQKFRAMPVLIHCHIFPGNYIYTLQKFMNSKNLNRMLVAPGLMHCVFYATWKIGCC